MSELPTALLGRTNERVTKLAYGAMELRGEIPGIGLLKKVEPAQAETILNAVLDAGINLIDTSPDYGTSEHYIGEYISHRRAEYFLASKCGCPIHPPEGEWPPRHVFTKQNVRAGIEQSLRRMKTDHLDLVQFHMSPSKAELIADDALAELEAMKREGKIRFIGMSGTLPNLSDHIAMGVFDAFQIPYSALEREHEAAISAAASAGAGVIVRGGVARGLPDLSPAATAKFPALYLKGFTQRQDRWDASDLEALLDGMSRMEFMLRFTLSNPDMTTTIVGTLNPKHLADTVAAAKKGPLPPDQVAAFKKRLDDAEGRQ